MTVSGAMLTAFVAVVEHAGVSRAAAHLGVSKSAVSKRVAQLETELGTMLFSRTTRRVALTPAGEAYLEFARRALEAMLAGDERLRTLRADPAGPIRMTATVSWGQRVLAKRLPEFIHRHPGIDLELRLDDRISDLAFERLDVALRWSASLRPGLVVAPIARVGWMLVAAPGYLATVREPRTPDDLIGHACLCYWREPSDDHWAMAAENESAEVRVRSRYRVDNPEAVRDAAIAGLGIAMLPDFLCTDVLADGRLVRVLPAWVPETRYGTGITAVTTPERMRLTRVRALIAFLARRPA